MNPVNPMNGKAILGMKSVKICKTTRPAQPALNSKNGAHSEFIRFASIPAMIPFSSSYKRKGNETLRSDRYYWHTTFPRALHLKELLIMSYATRIRERCSFERWLVDRVKVGPTDGAQSVAHLHGRFRPQVFRYEVPLLRVIQSPGTAAVSTGYYETIRVHVRVRLGWGCLGMGTLDK